MNSVGIDLHRKRSHVAALDDHGGELLSRRIVNDPDPFLALRGELDGESKIALEATYGWEWLADLLEEHGYELHLAHPLRTKAIASARVKTDAVDARTLAQLLRADLLPEAYVARQAPSKPPGCGSRCWSSREGGASQTSPGGAPSHGHSSMSSRFCCARSGSEPAGYPEPPATGLGRQRVAQPASASRSSWRAWVQRTTERRWPRWRPVAGSSSKAPKKVLVRSRRAAPSGSSGPSSRQRPAMS